MARIDAVEGLRYLYEHPDTTVSFDTETDGLRVDDGRNRAIGASVAYRNEEGRLKSFYLGWGHAVGRNVDEILVEQLAYVLLQEGRSLVAHNWQFDANALLTVGIDITQVPFWDTPTMALLINENAPFSKELGTLAQHYLGSRIKLSEWAYEASYPLKQEKTTGWPNTTPRMMDEYARMDTEATLLLWEHFVQHRFWLELPDEIWQNKMAVIRILRIMKSRGVALNQNLTRELLEEGEAEKERIKAELGLNPGSVKDRYELYVNRLNLPVIKTTPAGNPSFDKDVRKEYDQILSLRGDDTAKVVTAYAGWNTAVGLLLRPYLDLVSPDGRLRTTYTTHVTHTGRLSARDPNLQQISKEGKSPWNDRIKKCFVPRPGYVLLNADFSQLELRIAAGYANEEGLKQVFNEGRDIFDEMAAQLGMTRGETKILVYSMQYGAGKKRIKNAFGVSIMRAIQIIENYYATFPNFRRLGESITAMAERDMRVPLWTGRFRKLQYKSEGYKAMNSVMQGGAADIVERVMVKCFEAFDDDDTCRLLLTVHDSLVFEVREDLAEELAPKIAAMMSDVDSITQEVAGESFGVKFAVEVEVWE